MQTGTVIAIVIVVLILLAIWWFMTRAGRARAAQRDRERRIAEQSGAAIVDGSSAADRGAADGRTGPIVTESVGAKATAASGPAVSFDPHESGERDGAAGDNAFAGVQGSSLTSGDPLVDAREMIRILNLRDADAARLALTPEQFETLRRGERDGIDDDALAAAIARLRRMIR